MNRVQSLARLGLPAGLPRGAGWSGIDSLYVALVLFAAVALGWHVHSSAVSIREGLASQLFEQQGDVARLERALATLVAELDAAREGNGRPSALFAALDGLDGSLTGMRQTYTFDSVDGASAAHAMVQPVLLDLQRWLSDGVDELPPAAPVLIDLAHSRALEALGELRGTLGQMNVRAQGLLVEEAGRVERLRRSTLVALGVLALLALAITLVLMRQRNFEHAAATARARLSDAIDNVDLGLALYDARGELLLSNARLASLWPGSAQLLQPGSRLRDLSRALYQQGVVEPGDVEGEPVHALPDDPRGNFGPFITRMADDRYVQVEGHLTREGGTLLVHTDVTRSQQRQRHLQHQASHDALTSLPVRGPFERRLRQVLASADRHANQATLMFIDVDRFKQVNDVYGHAVGDRVLATVAARLRETLRDEDVVARLSGDEFAVVLENTRAWEESAATAERILQAMAAPIQVDAGTLFQTVSIGVAHYPMDADNAPDLMHCADIACYRAKENGRGAAQFYTPEMNEAASRRAALAARLGAALSRGEVRVEYRPRVACDSGELLYVLARPVLDDAALGRVETPEILGVVGRLGRAEELFETLWDDLQRLRERWTGGAEVPFVWFDLPLQQQRARDMTDALLRHAVTLHGRPLRIGVMVPHAAFADDGRRLKPMLEQLQDSGIGVGIRDFGGHGSRLAVLTDLSVRALELPDGLVPVAAVPGAEAAIRTIAAAAAARDVQVAAGPVSDPVVRERLAHCGVRAFHGPLAGELEAAETGAGGT